MLHQSSSSSRMKISKVFISATMFVYLNYLVVTNFRYLSMAELATKQFQETTTGINNAVGKGQQKGRELPSPDNNKTDGGDTKSRSTNTANEATTAGHLDDQRSGGNSKIKNQLSDLQLFVSAFPDGFDELRDYLIRSLNFFWPYDPALNILVVIDDTVLTTEGTTERNMTQTVQSFFHNPKRSNTKVQVAFNPRSDNTVYGKGWYIQQLIMLWGDNFTKSNILDLSMMIHYLRRQYKNMICLTIKVVQEL